jgi:Mor family transcriptional regulator
MSGDIIKRFIEILAEAQPSFSEGVALHIEQQLRHEFSGERVYITKRDESIGLLIAERFNGNNTDKIARELHVSRRTVYRALKKRRVATK